ncbi:MULTISPECIES: CBASS cGAMP-activated phospholipase [Vibrio]|uniref:CBASS cGAMP-activated phospholipase n=2 Tax=Vibrio TaxID=662 RepID=A0AAN0LLI2_9VIBR|nr:MULTISPECIES: CBASS cGAMP-activated phospholipase [Vibrio]NOI01747.1 patatin [Vibrio kanaloae]OEE04124.1 patatin [Vibrio cyclitrophicus ZF270]PMN20271.1 patatin [Vibrio splendidus]PTP73849.1 patatin [Vibrio splendidus]
MEENVTTERVRVLSLNGGGIRGLFTISVLAEIEQIIENQSGAKDVKVGDYFDLITGTSIGGILALGLAEGKSARQLKGVFYARGNDIFPRQRFLDSVIKSVKKLILPTYSSSPLRDAIVEMIGDEITFDDLTRRVMIPTVNLSTGRPQFFKTPHNPNFTRDGRLKLVDAALATSAAPTYFAPHFWQDLGAYFADGGLVANNPSFVGLHEVFGDMKSDFPHATYSDVHILNIGTMGEEYAISPEVLASKKKQGYFGLWGTGERLVLTTMTTNQLLHQYMLQRQLIAHDASGNYVSLDSRVPNEASKDITLDNSSNSSLNNLATRGQQLATEEYAKNPALRAFFSKPAKPFKTLVSPTENNIEEL